MGSLPFGKTRARAGHKWSDRPPCRNLPRRSGGAEVETVTLTDRKRIENFLRRDPFRHIFALGDLDDYFWPHTTWHALVDGEEINAVTVVYSGLSRPVLLALFDNQGTPFLDRLLRSTLHLLPACFDAHVSPGALEVLKARFRIRPHGVHSMMALTRPAALDSVGSTDIASLSKKDLPDLQQLYAESYPGNYFEPSMLDLGLFFGLRRSDVLVSAAGVLVYSKTYRVAALGNIATRPAHRRRGYAKTVTGELCRNLLHTVDHIGLSVKSDNTSAIRCYETLGFSTIGVYEQCTAEEM